MGDQFFTPQQLAKQLVAFLRRPAEACIVDFAAGNGELLRAAADKWPRGQIVATDIDNSCVARLRSRHPNWVVGRCDFLSDVSRRSSKVLHEIKGNVSLALLNPPFSYRGGAAETITFSGAKARCSRAMAFILNAVPYLAHDGRIVAIVPASCLSSEKDSGAWALLNRDFMVRRVASIERGAFPNCAASAVIVYISRQTAATRRLPRRLTAAPNGIVVRIVRGTVPMHAATNGMAGPGFPLVHTTELHGSRITSFDRSVTICRRYAVGPAVLLPRVGQPSAEKCVLYMMNRRVVLSDCVFAVECSSRDHAIAVREAITTNWKRFSASYHGTCAPYLTISRLRATLVGLGFTVEDGSD